MNSTTHGVVNPAECPKGSYCPSNSSHPQKCPKGYFGNSTRRTSLSQCHPCTAGYFCDMEGMTKPKGKCYAGYFCTEKAITPTPFNQTEGGRPCDQGYFCVEGSKQQTPCPIGTYGNAPKLHNVGECSVCDGGKFCAAPGLSSPTGSCLAGYYCSGRAELQNPAEKSYGDICPKGYYCPEQTTSPFACPPGTFNNETKGARPEDCLPCSGGSYCEGYANEKPDGLCDPGYYCQRGTYTKTPQLYSNLTSNFTSTCPIYSVNQTGNLCYKGTYCPQGSSYPITCEAGKYCETDKLNQPTGNCTAGYYCAPGSIKSDPRLCQAGHYCPEGTKIEVQCPPGTFNENEGQTDETGCKNCTKGFYCPLYGMSGTTFQCLQGYYCPSGSRYNNTAECPQGYYCPRMIGDPIPCPAGDY